MKTAGEMSRMCLVTHRPTSVEPATIVAAGSAASSVAKIVERGWHQQALLARSDLDAAAVAHCRKLCRDRLALQGERVLGGLAVVGDRHRRPHDRLVAGAAAEIALQRLLDLGVGRRRVGHPQRIERHHEARRAEAALRAVEIDHRLLHRMQAAVASPEMFDGDDMAAVERAEEADAGVDAFIDELALREPSDQHGASAAVALGAAFLGAAQRAAQPEIVEQRLVRRDIGERHALAIEEEANLVADFWLGHRLSSPGRSNSHRARQAAARGSASARPCRSGSARCRGRRAKEGACREPADSRRP